jgi:hypothetical protein
LRIRHDSAKTRLRLPFEHREQSAVAAGGSERYNPDLIVACVVGDGEAETGPLATSWRSNKFLDPATDSKAAPYACERA